MLKLNYPAYIYIIFVLFYRKNKDLKHFLKSATCNLFPTLLKKKNRHMTN